MIKTPVQTKKDVLALIPANQDKIKPFGVGSREVIPGLSYGVEGMRMGGLRRVRVSPHLAYGAAGVPGLIPANAVLTFEVELLEVLDSRPQSHKVTEMEQRHADGYAQHPVEPGEFDIEETERSEE